MRIICLDDHPTMLDSLVRELNIISPNAKISAFQDAETALEFAAENGCDVLFCEICLYGNDGLMFAEKMQAINPRVNIIFTTVCEEAERAKEVFRLHASGYITKPYTRTQLATELKNLRYPVKTQAPSAPQRSSTDFTSSLYRSPATAFTRPAEQKPEPKPAPTVTRTPVFVPESVAWPQVHPIKDPVKHDEAEEAEKAEEAETRPMSDKDLRRLSRAELLEILIVQTKENNKLRAQLKETRQKLDDKILTVEKAGSIAQAAMQVNGVFEAAQQAADQYLVNVQLHSQQHALREKEYALRAEQILADAHARCAAMERETSRKCDELTRTAQAEAQARWDELREKMESYLRQHEQLRSLMGMYQ